MLCPTPFTCLYFITSAAMILLLPNAPAKLRRANAIVIPAWASRAPPASAGC